MTWAMFWAIFWDEKDVYVIAPQAISAEVIGPSGPVYADFELTPTGGQGRSNHHI